MKKKIKLTVDTNSKIGLSDSLVENLKNMFSGCHINFLVGAGFSANVLGVLGNKEYVFEALRHLKSDNEIKQQKLDIIGAYEYWDFFEKSIYPIANLRTGITGMDEYVSFANTLYQILADKANPVLNKQANIFTTNYDPIIEIALERSKCICNDGFEGRILPLFSTSNFSKIYYREAFFSNRKAEIPSVNLIKIHGSVTWNKYSNEEIQYYDYIEKINQFYYKYNTIMDNAIMAKLLEKLESRDIEVLKFEIEKLISSSELDSALINYRELSDCVNDYKNQFLIVNPTKEKFSDTLLNKNYYEMLRMFSNEMEKENTLLVVSGFSFEDEHIRDLLKRSMVNPSLKVLIFCYEESDVLKYETKFSDIKNENISYIYLTGTSLSIAEMNQILGYIHI